MRIFALAVILAAGIVASVPQNVFCATDSEIEESIRDVLAQRHPTDTPEWWRVLGPSAPGIIVKLYENTSHTYHRVRLIEALGWFNDRAASEFIKQQAERTGDDVIRNAAIRSIGASRGTQDVEFISKFLGHKDPQTRLTAAEALRRIGDQNANKVLEKYMAEEKASWIVAKLKGEPPVPRAKLPVVSTSEDKADLSFSRDFSGTWKGYFIAPKAAASTALVSDEAVMTLHIENTTVLGGELLVKRKKQSQKFSIQKTTGKAARISGTLVKRISNTNSMELAFDAELVRHPGVLLLTGRISRLPGVFVLKRD
ncbi:MAG: HEAT repeat domain-containing protein [Bdellovibrionota bacterium]